jgi:hypothetical protein
MFNWLLKTGKSVDAYIADRGGKAAVPLQAWSGPQGSRKLRFPDFLKRHRMLVRLSALRSGCIYPRKFS